ncbi:P-loop NTPase fold protein [Glutamicibacter sp.]|uniref:KAP family P-loop NTPase fold protein n=1 Tax=Glutamicibacter sp. TaxID=1931995 RepID=UPI0028BE78FA|nr:P-loop NTPase fold protein [Glutamicibacter sp.]
MTRNFDEPLSPSDARFNEKSVSDLYERILDFKSVSKSGVISVTGEWGSGKTSLAEAAVEKLKTNHSWHTAKFEPWAYHDYTSMLEGFFATLTAKLKAEGIHRGARNALSSLLETISPYGDSVNYHGISLGLALRTTSKVLRKRGSLSDRKNEVNKQFSKFQYPLIVIVDDLDRLDSTELVSCFKVLRLLGRINNIYYILCYDEIIVTNLLSKTEAVGTEDPTLARKYLEKVSQIKVDVLEIFGTEQSNYFFSSVDDLKNLYQISDLLETDRLEQMWSIRLNEDLKTPRSMKVLMLNMRSSWKSIANEVNFCDFLMTSFLKEFYPELHKLIKSNAENITGTNNKPYTKEDVKRYPIRDYWHQELQRLRINSPETMLEFLALSFPSLENRAQNPGLWYSREIPIYERDYFDRYFRNMLAVDEVPEVSILAYIEDVNQSEMCDKSLVVSNALSQNRTDVAKKIVRHKLFPSFNKQKLYSSLVSLNSHKENFGWLALRNNGCGDILFNNIFERSISWSSEQIALEDLFEPNVPKGLFVYSSHLITDKVLSKRQWRDPRNADEDDTQLEEFLVKKIENSLQELFQIDPFRADLSILSGLSALNNIRSIDYTRKFLKTILNNSPLYTPARIFPAFLGIRSTNESMNRLSGVFSIKEFLDLITTYFEDGLGEAFPQAILHEHETDNVNIDFIPRSYRESLDFIQTYIISNFIYD